MMYTYEELKRDVSNRREPFHFYYRNFIALFEDMYDVTEIKAMYLKNFFNEEENQTLFFFTNKIVTITKEDFHFRFKENKGIVTGKELLISKESQRETELVIKFDNNEVLTLDNIKDSNPDMSWEYGVDIKELYKIL